MNDLFSPIGNMAVAAVVVLGAADALARTEYRLGGEDGNPWEAATSPSEAGEYFILGTEGDVERRVTVGITPFGKAGSDGIDIRANAIEPWFFDGSVNVAVTDPNTGVTDVPLPLVGGQVQVATSCVHAGTIQNYKPSFDGDPKTATFYKIIYNARFRSASGYKGIAILDLGVPVPLSRIRFYPRLGQRDDARLIEAFADPAIPLESFNIESYAENFLNGFTIRVADNSIGIYVKGPCDRNPHGTHSKHPNWPERGDRRFDVLYSTEENIDTVVDLRFPTRSVRWLLFEPNPTHSWEVAELEIYPEGYVRETGIVSQIMDFGKPVNWGRIRWSGDFPDGTRVEVRTRTGNTPDPDLYFEMDPNGNVVPTTKEVYEDINFLDQVPIEYDTENWTFWSPVYDFEGGRRDPSLPAESWEDGLPVVSEGLGRYLQLDIRMFGTFEVAPRLEQIAVLFSETPVAQEVVGEIWPVEVKSFEPETFTYVIKPRFDEEDSGFDRLEVITHSRAEQVRSVTIDGVHDVDLDEFPPVIEDDRLVAAFPFRVADPDSSFKQIDVVFDAPVLRFGTQFTGWVYDSSDPDLIKQRIEAGNATFRFSGDDLSVRSPIGGDLLADVTVGPNPFTPNGDGVNDRVSVEYKLREVTDAREVLLEIFDLAGRPVATLSSGLTTSGAYRQTWDGRTAAGALAPPGTYLYRLRLEAEKVDEIIGLFALAY